MFAATATRLTVPVAAATIGAVTANAVVDTAVTSAIGRGHPCAHSRSTATGASTTRPPVAETESAKPISTARSGSTRSNTPTAAHKAGSARRSRPETSASNAIAPIATDLKIPRQTIVLPNGDILVAEGKGGGAPRLTPKGFSTLIT